MSNLNDKVQNLVGHQKKWYGRWHALAGITAGMVLIVVSLTGALLVFETELDVWLNPSIFEFKETGQQPRLSFEEITIAAKKQLSREHLEGMFYNEKSDSYRTFIRESRKNTEQVIFNPYTGEMTGRRVYKHTIMGFIRNLHRTLLLPFVGRYLVGLSSLICVVLMITGLRLWIPKRWRSLKRRLSVKWDAGSKRINFDLHNTLGVFFAPIISLIALTGVVITFSQIILLFLFLLSFEPPKSIGTILNQKSTYVEAAVAKSVSEIVVLAEAHIPDAKVTGISFPADSSGAFNVNMRGPFSSQTGNSILLFVDQYSGAIINSSEDEKFKLTKAYLNWVTPIHYGTFGGLTTRIIALFASLCTAFLFISGLIIWKPRWEKRKNKRAKKRPSITQNKRQQHDSTV